MTNIKEIIEIALNDGYTMKRFEVKEVEVGRTMVTVSYFDKLKEDLDSCQFSI